MKKIAKSFVLFSAILFLSSNAFGQYFKEKDKVVNVGIGLGNTLYTGSYYSTSIPPLSASFDYGLKEGVGPGVIGIGGFLGISGSKYENPYGSIKYTYTVIGARGTYHLVDIADKLDAYGGLMLGYAIYSSSTTGDYTLVPAAESSRAAIGIFVGAHYYISDKFAIMAELGYGVAIFNIGVGFKL